MAFNAMPAFETADELQAVAPGRTTGTAAARRSSSTSPPAGRCGRTCFDAWRGKRTAAGPILGPESPEQVRRGADRAAHPGRAAARRSRRTNDRWDDGRREHRHPEHRPARTSAAAPSTSRASSWTRRRTSRSPSARSASAGASSTGGPSARIIFALVLVFFLFRVVLNVDFSSTVELIASREPGFLLAGLRRLLPDLPAARLRWRLHPAKRRHAGPVRRRDRDPVPVLVRELPRAGQAG